MSNKIKLLWDMSKELKLKLYQFVKPTYELELKVFASELQKSFSKGVCVENHAFHTKPVW